MCITSRIWSRSKCSRLLVVAGGAAGGGTAPFGGTNGAGGGAGGVRFFADPTNNPQGGPAAPRNAPAGITVTATAFPITVGAGGAPTTFSANPGSNSIFSSITSTGGGGGGSACSPLSPTEYGRPGGSGGGQTGGGTSNVGLGNTPPVSPPQGNPGGCGAQRAASPEFQSGAGGGGGASGAGNTAPTCSQPGKGGGTGQYVPDAFIGPTAPSYGCSPAPQAPNGRLFAGGGGGGAGGGGTGGDPGPGGGGRGGDNGATNTDGVANTGGGAGGPFDQPTARNGGSGIVMIRYKYQ